MKAKQSSATASPLRPILHHLNADSSWLLQLPQQEDEVGYLGCYDDDDDDDDSSNGIKKGSRIFFNIVMDPWLDGPQSDVARWFSTQRHAIPSAVRSMTEVARLAMEVEDESIKDDEKKPAIDVIVISHEFTDHCHRDTLLQVDPSVPVFAPKMAADLIRSWKHFEHVVEIPLFEASAEKRRKTAAANGLLPDWVSVTRIQDEKDSLYYHSAVVMTFGTAESAECVVYTPHGVAPSALACLQEACPSVQTLCFIHGLHDVQLSVVQQLNLGGHNGLKGQRALKPKYWVATHDEVKKGGGLVSHFLRRKIISVDQALREEKMTQQKSGEAIDSSELEAVLVDEVGNGERKVLA